MENPKPGIPRHGPIMSKLPSTPNKPVTRSHTSARKARSSGEHSQESEMSNKPIGADKDYRPAGPLYSSDEDMARGLKAQVDGLRERIELSLWLRGFVANKKSRKVWQLPNSDRRDRLKLEKLEKEGVKSPASVISPSPEQRESKAVGYLTKRLNIELWNALLETEGVPDVERPALIVRFHIEIARVLRPKWVGRLERGGELATLTAPLFLKHVHAGDIAQDGTVHNEIIRAIDPDLMQAVELYISKRRIRGQDLGDAEGLKFVLTRPSSRTSARRPKEHPTP